MLSHCAQTALLRNTVGHSSTVKKQPSRSPADFCQRETSRIAE